MTDRAITIYIADSCQRKRFTPQTLTAMELFAGLSSSRELPITVADFKALPRDQQNAMKDAPCFIAGTLKGGRRQKFDILTRCAVVLDIEGGAVPSVEAVAQAVAALGCASLIYSTAKHCPEAPRLRAVFPLSADISGDQYGAAMRLLCQRIDPTLSWFDKTAVDRNRLMFCPTHCNDVAPVCIRHDGPLLNAADLLRGVDMDALPRFAGEMDAPAGRPAEKQADPLSKRGIVGEFCRTYSVEEAIAKFLPEAYAPVDGYPGRYTFLAGSTSGGAVVYDGGRFLFSHHSTDPCSEKLVNAFDLVRIHRFGGMDTNVTAGTAADQLPSFKAMCGLADADPDTAETQRMEREEEIRRAFNVTPGTDELPRIQPTDFSDAGNAGVFCRYAARKLRYCKALGWLVWDETRWEPNRSRRFGCSHGVHRADATGRVQ